MADRCAASSRDPRTTFKPQPPTRPAPASRSGASGRPEPFPLRPPRFVDVNVRVHQPRKNGSLAKVLHGNFLRPSNRRNDVEDSSVLDEHSRRNDSLRRDNASREKSCETHIWPRQYFPCLRAAEGDRNQI